MSDNKKNKKETFTSLKIKKDLYDNFKVSTVKSNFNLKLFVNLAMHKFVYDNNFQNEMNKYLEISGSII